MKVMILGGDGYLGWPTAMDLSLRGHDVFVIDNYLKRDLVRATNSGPLLDMPRLPERIAIFAAASGKTIEWRECDCTDYDALAGAIGQFGPDAIIHYAEQPSAPFSMAGRKEAQLTLHNNITSTFNLVWAIREHAPDAHIIKLGTMGEYGTPNIDIEEGWIDIDHNGRSDRFLFPRQGGSLYHTSKIIDTDLLWFYARQHGIRVTDLMQGPVYGLFTAGSAIDERLLPHFYYDDIFGTVLNRFVVQAATGIPLTIYGKGDQTRGFLNINDTLQCVELALSTPAQPSELRIFNQFTETFSVTELASRVQEAATSMGLSCPIEKITNPRKEAEKHYYNPKQQALRDLGLQPHFLTQDVICDMINFVLKNRDKVDRTRIFPRVNWK